jgi:myo-inositol-1(or 4)-monophosphatase
MFQDQELLFIERILRKAGAHVLAFSGERIASTRKQEMSQIVTSVDVSSEELLIAEIRQQYPSSGIVAEESGLMKGQRDDYWIIDPIDGTSNFANGLSWFGVMVAHVIGREIQASGIYLPVSDEMYLAKSGIGAFKNGKKFRVREHSDLSLLLLGFGTDGSTRSMNPDMKGKLYASLLRRVLNIRTTNSAVDYAYAVEGKFGGLINLENKIWDIAPIIPLAKEAGCIATDIKGQGISCIISDAIVEQNFTLLVAGEAMHKELLTILQSDLS